jgi:hypothetical protein
MNGVRVVASADEVSYHMIEVAYSALQLRKQPAGAEVATPAPKRAEEAIVSPQKSPAAGLPAPMAVEVTKPSVPALAATTPVAAPVIPAAVPVAPAASAAPAGAPPAGADLSKALIALMRDSGNDEGLAVSAMAAATRATEAAVRACMDDLVEQGDVFQTIDDDHFALL